MYHRNTVPKISDLHSIYSSSIFSPQHSKLVAPIKVDCAMCLQCHAILTGPSRPNNQVLLANFHPQSGTKKTLSPMRMFPVPPCSRQRHRLQTNANGHRNPPRMYLQTQLSAFQLFLALLCVLPPPPLALVNTRLVLDVNSM